MLEAVQRRLDENPEAMRQRRETVEHPFGSIKAWMGATHFLMKRLKNVRTEMALSVLAYNLTRVMNIPGIRPLMAAIRAQISPCSARNHAIFGSNRHTGAPSTTRAAQTPKTRKSGPQTPKVTPTPQIQPSIIGRRAFLHNQDPNETFGADFKRGSPSPVMSIRIR